MSCPGSVHTACTCKGHCGWRTNGYVCACSACTPVPAGGSGGGGSGFASGGLVSGAVTSVPPGGSGSVSAPGGGGGAGGSGLVSPAPVSSTFPRGSGSGMTGFAEQAELDFEPEFEMQPVRGLRMWTLTSPDFRQQPDQAAWGSVLCGATGFNWTDDVLEAHCNNGYSHQVPTDIDKENGVSCGCGFWAYWDVGGLGANWSLSSSGLPVVGIIEGYGRVLLGERGFRSQKARIAALAPAFDIQAEVSVSWREPDAAEEERIRQMAQSHADAWMAVIQDRLGQMYPRAAVYATVSGMLAAVQTYGRPT